MYGLEFPEAPKTYKQLPRSLYVFLQEKILRSFDRLVSFHPVNSFEQLRPGLSFSHGYHRRWGPLGHCSSFDPATDNPSGPRKVGKNRWRNDDRLGRMISGTHQQYNNSDEQRKNSRQIPLQLASFFFREKKLSQFINKKRLIHNPSFPLFPCLGPFKTQNLPTVEILPSQLSTQLPKSSHNFMKPFPSNSALPAPPFHPTKLEAWIWVFPKIGLPTNHPF